MVRNLASISCFKWSFSSIVPWGTSKEIECGDACTGCYKGHTHNYVCICTNSKMPLPLCLACVGSVDLLTYKRTEYRKTPVYTCMWYRMFDCICCQWYLSPLIGVRPCAWSFDIAIANGSTGCIAVTTPCGMLSHDIVLRLVSSPDPALKEGKDLVYMYIKHFLGLFWCTNQISARGGWTRSHAHKKCMRVLSHINKPKSRSKAMMALLDEKVCWNLRDKNIQCHTPAVHLSNFL